MDDLELVRGLGHDLDHEPPATLVRQRHRLAETAAGRTNPRRVRGWTLIGVAAVVTAALILVPTVLLRGGGAGKPGPDGSGQRPGAAKALNILVLGSDERGDGLQARSDTIMLVHVPRDRGRVSAVSLPRDLMATLPSCRTRSGEVRPGGTGPLNSAYAVGGLACSLKAVEKLTGVRVDQALSIDFAGFKRMVNALGGVEVVMPKAVWDRASGLRLGAGRQLVRGDQALAYVRSRRGLGDGSDLERIKRQQRFMASMLRRAKQLRITEAPRLAAFLKAASGSIKSTGPLDLGMLRELAESLDKTGTDAVRFSTVPVRPHPGDANRLVLDEPAARRVFQTFRS
ncbi:LCP family protein [Actinomadura fulvescens]|uniref:Cell envelope-related transcriptional attenuator domain-containing protein n=1 Tax=Actinomadura fulvescens TaxID=46160 RepID=A0ABP6C210_9ACTN